LPEIARQQVEHFFAHYKDLEPGKWVKIIGWGSAEKTREIIEAARRRYTNAMVAASTRTP
jgi:inorganic pyrophosphatase